MIIHSSEQATLSDHNSSDLLLQEGVIQRRHTQWNYYQKEKFVSRHIKCIIDNTNDTNTGGSKPQVVPLAFKHFRKWILMLVIQNIQLQMQNTRQKPRFWQNWVSDVVKVDLTQSNVRRYFLQEMKTWVWKRRKISMSLTYLHSKCCFCHRR